MSDVQHLAIREAPPLPSAGEWQTMVQMAGMLVPTGFLPTTIRTAEQAVAIILKGQELRIPPMYALSNIVVVQGKPTCSAELMLALIYRDQGDAAMIVEDSTAEACRVTYRRRGWDRPRSFAFTIEDARRAGLAGKGTWAQYPQAMLRARCISAVARMAFPDSIAGMYLPEELGATVRVRDDGEVEFDAQAYGELNGDPQGSLPAAAALPEPTPIRPPASSAAPPASTAPVRPLLEQALALAERARGLGLTPTEPPATANDAQLGRWIAYWTQEVAERERDAAIDERKAALEESLARARAAEQNTQAGAVSSSEEPPASPTPAVASTAPAEPDEWEKLKRQPAAAEPTIPDDDALINELQNRFGKAKFEAEALGLKVAEPPVNARGLTKAVEDLEGVVRRARAARTEPAKGRR